MNSEETIQKLTASIKALEELVCSQKNLIRQLELERDFLAAGIKALTERRPDPASFSVAVKD